MTRRRIVTVNVQHGGGRQVRALTEFLLGFDADVLVVTEFRAGLRGGELSSGLISAGYELTRPDVPQGRNTVLIASRSPLIAHRVLVDRLLDPRHLWVAELEWATICGVYMPVGKTKFSYWDEVVRAAGEGRADMFIGDFNTGTNTLDKDEAGAKFFGADRMALMEESGYTELWRHHHPHTREYSWFSHSRGNGFRIDHAFASPEFASTVTRVEYDHSARLAGITDHAALVIDVEAEPDVFA